MGHDAIRRGRGTDVTKREVTKCDVTEAVGDVATFAGYLLLTYFSRRTCGTGSPKPFSVSKQASTMFGLPHR